MQDDQTDQSDQTDQTDPPELAVVAGATGALGRAITCRLTERGLHVLAIARSAEALQALAAGNPRITPMVGDMADNGVIDTIRCALTRPGGAALSGPVRIAVQAVGLPIRARDAAFDPASLGVAVNIKAGGLLRLASALEGHLQPGSRLAVLGGYHGFEPDPTAIGPGVTNAALANLVRILSHRFGAQGVSVHMVSPGPVDTPRIRKLADDASRQRGIPAAEILAQWCAESSLPQLITTDQVAWAVALLLDPEASALHGSVLHLDGGRRRGIL